MKWGTVEVVYQQYRKIEAGGISTEDLDSEIEVKTSKDQGLQFNVEIYNLKPETWNSVKEGDLCRVTLGWVDGPSNSVVLGTIKKRRRKRGSKAEKDTDVAYQLTGTDHADVSVKKRLNQTWKDQSPSQIVRDIAEKIDLQVGEIQQVAGTSDGMWAMTEDKPVNFWLDRLVGLANKLTDKSWEWFTDGGRLFFVNKSRRVGKNVLLSYDTVLRYIGPAGGKSDSKSTGDELEFEAYVDPRITRKAPVAVETDEYEGAYKVVDYTYTSSTLSGDHKVEGTLSPLDGEYVNRDSVDYYLESEDPGVRGAARAVNQQREGGF